MLIFLAIISHYAYTKKRVPKRVPKLMDMYFNSSKIWKKYAVKIPFWVKKNRV